MGDCNTWDGTTAKKKNKKKEGLKGLAGSLYDFQVIQEKLYARPSGEFWTNQLSSLMLVNNMSIIDRKAVLKQLRLIISKATPDNAGYI